MRTEITRRTKPLNAQRTLGDGCITVRTGSNPKTLSDDRIILNHSGSAHLEGPSAGYSAGYLAMRDAPLARHLGSDLPASTIVRRPQNDAPTRKFDAAFAAARPGTSVSLTRRYDEEGIDPGAHGWEGFCNRWSYSALDPKVAARVNQPLAYKGSFFSIAELRGLASFLGDSDQDYSKTLGTRHDDGVTAREPTAWEELDAILTLIGPDTGGFFANIDGGHHNFSAGQVWNQPFVSADVEVKEKHGLEKREMMLFHASKLGLHSGHGHRVFKVEVDAKYVSEAPGLDDYEGAPVHDDRHWNFVVITDRDGNVQGVDRIRYQSDRRIATLWAPYRTGVYGSPEASFFFNELLPQGVPLGKVRDFERWLGRLTAQGSVTEEQKAQLVAQFKGIRAAYPDQDLDRALAPLGLTASQFD